MCEEGLAKTAIEYLYKTHIAFLFPLSEFGSGTPAHTLASRVNLAFLLIDTPIKEPLLYSYIYVEKCLYTDCFRLLSLYI